MRFSDIPVRCAVSRRLIGHLANIGRGSSLDERDAPEGGDLASPHFEDGRLGGDNLRRPCVVDLYLLLVEDGKVPGITHLANASEQVERNVRHHIKILRGLAELVLRGFFDWPRP